MPDGREPDTTAGRLAEYTMLMNRHGADSGEALAYLREHRRDPEFVSLARVARDLKAALAGGRRETGGEL